MARSPGRYSDRLHPVPCRRSVWRPMHRWCLAGRPAGSPGSICERGCRNPSSGAVARARRGADRAERGFAHRGTRRVFPGVSRAAKRWSQVYRPGDCARSRRTALGIGWRRTADRLSGSEIGVQGLRELSGISCGCRVRSSGRASVAGGRDGHQRQTTGPPVVVPRPDDLGLRCGVIGTLGTGFPGALQPGISTTPDAIALHRLLLDFLKRGAVPPRWKCHRSVSTGAASTARRFNVAILTNLTRDHLDCHGNMKECAEGQAEVVRFS